MKIVDSLTNPEDSAERLARRRVLEQIKKCGGCGMCIHRDNDVLAWGRSVCSANESRTFPACTADGARPQFALDETKLKERAL